MNKKVLIIAAILVLAGGTSWYLWYFSDKQVIKRKFNDMAASLSKEEGEETPLQIATKMLPVKNFLAPACEVMVPQRNYHRTLEPGMIIRYLIMYRSRLASLEVSIDEISVEIPDPGKGEVSTLVNVTANRNRPDFFDETHRLEFSLEKQENDWQLHQAVVPGALVDR